MIPDDDMLHWTNEILQLFSDFLDSANYHKDVKYAVSTYDLIDVVTRVDRRVAYYSYFHEGMAINELKEAGLYAYWILRFRPFKIIDKRYADYPNAYTINESFALYIILSALYYVKQRGLVGTRQEQNAFHKKLLYTFRFRHISLASMMLLAESI